MIHAAAAETAFIHEIFSGIQGEGTLVGYRHIFVRFHGCNLSCAYCDTPASREGLPGACMIEESAGSRRLIATPNPIGAEELLAALMRLQQDYAHHSVSLTGGEPLLHQAFLNICLPVFHAAGLSSYLETNGVLYQALAALSSPPKYLAMDMKLPSVTGAPPQWEAHALFLGTAIKAVPIERLQVKLVFGEASLQDLVHAAEVIAAGSPAISCILQPVTAHVGGPHAPSARTTLDAQRVVSAILRDVRVIPQTHVMLGQW